ncbi:NAD+ ADP-ribosyltransferase [Prunus dulcis]|uniref:NAD+ ADP-ribosyltransferase n=1 Tax=Prunus dulcis TaxID=3755 RepID=A0A4Y1R827_PRUDU|nr:NAD+ ADP-ribosyltransferase [Prunus dulcis]
MAIIWSSLDIFVSVALASIAQGIHQGKEGPSSTLLASSSKSTLISTLVSTLLMWKIKGSSAVYGLNLFPNTIHIARRVTSGNDTNYISRRGGDQWPEDEEENFLDLCNDAFVSYWGVCESITLVNGGYVVAPLIVGNVQHIS